MARIIFYVDQAHHPKRSAMMHMPYGHGRDNFLRGSSLQPIRARNDAIAARVWVE